MHRQCSQTHDLILFFFGGPLGTQELDLMILLGRFQLRYSMIPWIRHFKVQFIGETEGKENKGRRLTSYTFLSARDTRLWETAASSWLW